MAEFQDIQIESFNQDGSITYSDVNTGEIITDPEIIAFLGALDGYVTFGATASFNNGTNPISNPYVFNVGNNNYDDTVFNVSVVGSGNTVGSNVSDTQVFGVENTIETGLQNLNIQGNYINVSQSSNTTVFYNLTESRTITSSFNNVILNPIKDVGLGSGSFIDTTGSVYIGNLINQGTAQFRDGLNAYNYLRLNNQDVAISMNGSAIHTFTQLAATANTPEYMSFGTVLFEKGLDIEANTITILADGTYNIQFSAQLLDTGAGTEYVWIWLRKNGVDVPNSNTKIRMKGNNEAIVAAWNWMDEAVAGDYYNIIWAVSDTDIQILAEPANAFSPAIPSTIVTVNRV